MSNKEEVGQKIQKILTDKKTLSTAAASILVCALLIALWRREKHNKQRQQELLQELEKADAEAEALGITETERRELAHYVVKQDLADRLSGFIKQLTSRLELHKKERE